jgi:hypothetical protein
MKKTTVFLFVASLSVMCLPSLAQGQDAPTLFIGGGVSAGWERAVSVEFSEESPFVVAEADPGDPNGTVVVADLAVGSFLTPRRFCIAQVQSWSGRGGSSQPAIQRRSTAANRRLQQWDQHAARDWRTGELLRRSRVACKPRRML